MKLEVHKHYYTDIKVEELLKQILLIIHKFDKQGVTMAESAEMTAFRNAVTESLSNIAADIQRLLARSTGMSDEDKAALTEIGQRVADAAAVVPEDGTEGGGEEPTGRSR